MPWMSPGVYWKEEDFSTYVQALATTIFAVVITATKGPINEKRYVTKPEEFTTVYGFTHPDHIGTYACLQFLKDGTSLWVNRVESSTNPAKKATGEVTDYSGNTVLQVTSIDPGTFYNNTYIRVIRSAPRQINDSTAIEDVSGDPLNISLGSKNFGGTFNQAIVRGSVTVSDGTQTLTDDKEGNLTGNGTGIVEYDTGKLTASLENFNYSNNVVATAKALGSDLSITVGTGDDNTTEFSGTFGQPVAPGTVIITDGVHTLTDDLNGGLTGDGSGVFNYETGEFSAVFDTPPADGAIITAQAKAVGLDLQIPLLSKQWSGSFGQQVSPGTVSIKAGNWTLQDDGKGNLQGNYGGGSVTYTTGDVSVVFSDPVPANVLVTGDAYSAVTSVSFTIEDTPIGYKSLIIECEIDDGKRVVAYDNGQGGIYTGDGTVYGNVNYDTGKVTLNTSPGHSFAHHSAILASYSYYTSFGIEVRYKHPVKDLDILLESFSNLVMREDSEYFIKTVVNRSSKHIRIEVPAGVAQFPANGDYFLSGGTDGIEGILPSDYIGVVAGSVRTGLQVFANEEEIDINVAAIPGITDPAVTQALLDFVNQRRDCMVLPDPPLGISKEDVVDWADGKGAWDPYPAINTSYAALYWPWIKIRDPYNVDPETKKDLELFIPPSGIVAVIYARNDLLAEVWYAPAGENRAIVYGAIGLEYSCSKGDRDFLFANRINPICDMNKIGIVIWGDKTALTYGSAFDAVSVRRLVTFIEKSIVTAVRPLLYEPNTPKLWDRFHLIVDPFLRDLKGREALEDYDIVCDKRTNPPEVIDRYELRANILLKPVKAVRAILLNFRILQTGADIKEFEI